MVRVGHSKQGVYTQKFPQQLYLITMIKKKVYKLFCGLKVSLAIAPFFLIASSVLAKNDLDTCKQVIVVGDVNWPPYVMQDSFAAGSFDFADHSDIDGVAIALVRKIFAELDLPVQIAKFDSKRNIFNGLNVGDIDIIVNTYLYNDLEEVADIIKPGYLMDPVVVYMRKGSGFAFKRWDDLIGKRGVMTDNFTVNEKFASYASKYLYLHAKGSLSAIIDMVNDQKADYLIGSKLQLEYGIKQALLQDALEILPTIAEPHEMHMGFAKNSLCRAYLPYLRKRLLELKADGAIDDLVTHYLAKDGAATAASGLPNPSAPAMPGAGSASSGGAMNNIGNQRSAVGNDSIPAPQPLAAPIDSSIPEPFELLPPRTIKEPAQDRTRHFNPSGQAEDVLPTPPAGAELLPAPTSDSDASPQIPSATITPP